MSAMLVDLGAVESSLSKDSVASHRLSAARQSAETTVKSIRDISLLLRPSMLDDLGLVPALKWQAREMARRTGLKVNVDAEEGADSLPDSHRTCIYRVVQEALNNCAKHSKAKRVKVLVRQNQDEVEFSVQDDGVGFNPASDKGMGRLGMEERINRLRGALRIESEKGHGTTLSAVLPLKSMGA